MTAERSCFIIKSLELTNYRCFSKLSLDLHDQLTVFVAPNGCGKTAVLDAIAIAFRLFVDTLEGRSGSKGFDVTDIRKVLNQDKKMEPVPPVTFRAVAHHPGHDIYWRRELLSEKASRTTTVNAKALKKYADYLSDDHIKWVEGKNVEPLSFPLIAYYGTGRLWGVGKLTEGKKAKDTTPNARNRGYTDCLSTTSSHYKAFVDWFRRFSYEADKNPDSPHMPERPLSVVQKAVDIALAPSGCGWHGLEWDFVEDTIVAQHPDYGRLPVDFLSDGIRNMIGLVADIAHRAARLNPQFGAEAAEKTPGIVLIDEVDMHLHPSWQQVVLKSLQDAFPEVQFIVTTHSPQVLTTVDKKSIRIIRFSGEQVSIEQPFFQTLGVESADVLASIMGVDPVPQVEEARWLNEYRALIEDGDIEGATAQDLRSKLISHFGTNHPLMLDCDRLIRFQAFKRQRVRSEEG